MPLYVYQLLVSSAHLLVKYQQKWVNYLNDETKNENEIELNKENNKIEHWSECSKTMKEKNKTFKHWRINE